MNPKSKTKTEELKLHWCEHFGPKSRCEYQACGAPTAYAVRFGYRDHPLCIEHADPKYHPPGDETKIRPVDGLSAGSL